MTDFRSVLEDEGYVVVPGVVARDRVRVVIDDIERHFSIKVDDPASWPAAGLPASGIVEVYHYPSMWNVRQDPALHAVFAEVFGQQELTVSIDRLGVKPPTPAVDPTFTGFLHWDADLRRYPDVPRRVQGLVALTDTDETMGGFQCAPSIYRNLEEWLVGRQAPDARHPPVDASEAVPVPARAGDLLLWSNLMPHGNGVNRSSCLRLCQYVTMFPVGPESEAHRARLAAAWRSNTKPAWNVPKEGPIVPEQHDVAPLTALGRKLVGADPWDA